MTATRAIRHFVSRPVGRTRPAGDGDQPTIYVVIWLILWVFFQAISVLNGWGGILGYVIEPFLLASVLAAIIVIIGSTAKPDR